MKNENVYAEERTDRTGFQEQLDGKEHMRSVSLEGLDVIGSGAIGTIYRLSQDKVVKVYKRIDSLSWIQYIRENSWQSFLLGVPCAMPSDIVKAGNRYGIIFELLNGATLVQRIRENPNRLEELAAACAELLRKLHRIEVPEGCLPPPDLFLHKCIDAWSDYFTTAELEKLHALFRAIPVMNRFIHSDYHARNVMETDDGKLVVMDLDRAGAGNPLYDLIYCNLVYDYMMASTQDKDGSEMGHVGLTYGEMRRFAMVFQETLYGSTQRVKAVNQRLSPYGELMYMSTLTRRPNASPPRRSACAKKIRETVLSRYDELYGSLAGDWAD